jgi:hypothetical protein
LPKVPDIRWPGERGLSFGLGGWSTSAHIWLKKGRAAATDYPGDMALNSLRRFGEYAEFATSAGAHNMLRVTALKAQGVGSTNAPTDLVLWNKHYNAGDYITTAYRIRTVKVSFEYLTWPYPAKTSRFRLKSLWNVQWIDSRTGFDAPRNPITDSAGNALSYNAVGSKWIILPSIGLGMQEYISPNVSLEVNGAGFMLPHRANLWDADAAANIRLGHYEVRLGAKALHFRTSPNADFGMQGTIFGPFLSLRWHSDEAK